ncbi:anthrax toxin lethal factor-related metalloendopeptidase [Aquibacillus halophilus]|nr:toxin [Aquibacillus halophilus]
MRKYGKKILFYLIVLLFLLLPFIDVTKPFSGIILQKAMGNEDLHHIQKLRNSDLLDELIVIPEKVKDKDSLINMVRRINSIDRPLLELLVNQGVKIRLFEGNLTDEPLLYHLKWEKPRGWKKDVTWEDVPGSGGSWLISAKIGASMPGNGHGSINLELHEIGHTVFNLIMTNPDYTKEFQSSWEQEVHEMFYSEQYFINHTSEYFAEMFAYYYYSEESAAIIKLKAPKTYKFFRELKSLNFNKIPRNFY